MKIGIEYFVCVCVRRLLQSDLDWFPKWRSQKMTRTISIWWLVVSTPRQIGNCIQIRVTPNYPKKVTIAALPVIEYVMRLFCQVWLWFFETKILSTMDRSSGFLDRMTEWLTSFLGLIGQESLNYPFRGDSNNANLSWFFRNLPLYSSALFWVDVI